MSTGEVSDDELFNGAVEDREPETIQDAPSAEPEPQETHARDERGRFAAKEAPEVEPTAEKPAVDDDAAQVPSWRVREINEEKRAAIAERDALRAEREQWQRQQRQPQKEPEKVAKPDPLLDPEGYATAIREEIRQEALAERREESLQRAAEANPDEFREAYQAAQRVVDPALKARMQASRDPGKTLLEWHREQKTRQEIGGDLSAYKQRLRDEALKDPEFRKAAMEAWRAESSPQANGRPSVSLPPSLSGMSRSNSLTRGQQTISSDDELFQELTG